MMTNFVAMMVFVFLKNIYVTRNMIVMKGRMNIVVHVIQNYISLAKTANYVYPYLTSAMDMWTVSTKVMKNPLYV